MLNTPSRNPNTVYAAREEVQKYGRITAKTCARLEALGFDVGALEQRLINR